MNIQLAKRNRPASLGLRCFDASEEDDVAAGVDG
jgi:hypothetical protein